MDAANRLEAPAG